MIIKLIQPPAKNWLLIAAELNDPPMWDRFVPCHTTESQRWQYESTVKIEAASTGLALKQCKEMLSKGVCVFEYNWEAADDDILLHAMQVADQLNVELTIEASSNAA